MGTANPRTLTGRFEALCRRAGADLLGAMSTLDFWLAAAIFVLALASLSLSLRPDATVFLKPLSEDGYYSLAVARSIAAGHGMTIDGGTLTNGIQPLLTVIQAGLFWLAKVGFGGSDLEALRLVLVLYWLLYLATGAMLVVTVSVALVLVTDPKALVTTTRKVAPLSAAVAEARV